MGKQVIRLSGWIEENEGQYTSQCKAVVTDQIAAEEGRSRSQI